MSLLKILENDAEKIGKGIAEETKGLLDWARTSLNELAQHLVKHGVKVEAETEAALLAAHTAIVAEAKKVEAVVEWAGATPEVTVATPEVTVSTPEVASETPAS